MYFSLFVMLLGEKTINPGIWISNHYIINALKMYGKSSNKRLFDLGSSLQYHLYMCHLKKSHIVLGIIFIFKMCLSGFFLTFCSLSLSHTHTHIHSHTHSDTQTRNYLILFSCIWDEFGSKLGGKVENGHLA